MIKDILENALQSRVTLFTPDEVVEIIKLLLFLETPDDSDPRFERLKKLIQERLGEYLRGGELDG